MSTVPVPHNEPVSKPLALSVKPDAYPNADSTRPAPGAPEGTESLRLPYTGEPDIFSIAAIPLKPAPPFESEREMRLWLASNGVDCREADSRKGLRTLFEEITQGGSRLLIDEVNCHVVRASRDVILDVEVTLQGARYKIFELCQISLEGQAATATLDLTQEGGPTPAIRRVGMPAAQMRDSHEPRETILAGEDVLAGARRSLTAALGLSEAAVSRLELHSTPPLLSYEEPIDWPGIPSLVETQRVATALPEEYSRTFFVRLDGESRITFYVAAPRSAALPALMAAVIPRLLKQSITSPAGESPPVIENDAGWILLHTDDPQSFGKWLGRDEEGLGFQDGRKRSLGTHLLIELFGCEEETLREEAYVGTAMVDAAKESKATVVEQSFHQFRPYGVSGAVIIQESHYTIHTWPEHGYAAVDLFYCGGTVLVHKAVDVLRERFRPKRLKFLVVRRGLDSEVTEE